MGFPDWNNGIDLIPNLDFIVPCNGLVVLNADQLPAHYHNLYTSGQLAANRNGSVWGIEYEGWTLVEENTGSRCGRTGYSGNTSGKTMPHENRPPYIAVYYIIRME